MSVFKGIHVHSQTPGFTSQTAVTFYSFLCPWLTVLTQGKLQVLALYGPNVRGVVTSDQQKELPETQFKPTKLSQKVPHITQIKLTFKPGVFVHPVPDDGSQQEHRASHHQPIHGSEQQAVPVQLHQENCHSEVPHPVTLRYLNSDIQIFKAICK